MRIGKLAEMHQRLSRQSDHEGAKSDFRGSLAALRKSLGGLRFLRADLRIATRRARRSFGRARRGRRSSLGLLGAAMFRLQLSLGRKSPPILDLEPFGLFLFFF